MRVENLMSRAAVCCTPDDRLSRAAQLMWEHDCGALPVVDGTGRLVSMITDRDLCMAAYTKGESLTGLRVADAMAPEAAACRSDQTITDAATVMRERRVRRLPVVDANEQVVGVLSFHDIVGAAARAARSSPRNGLTDRMIVRTLADIGARA